MTSRLMCRTRSAYGYSDHGALGLADRHVEVDLPDSFTPVLEVVVQDGQGGLGVTRPCDGRQVEGAVTEVVVGPHPQAGDGDVGEPPGDGGDGRRFRRRVRPVDREHTIRPATDRPAIRHRLPEVLVVGETFEPGPQACVPLEIELVEQLFPGRPLFQATTLTRIDPCALLQPIELTLTTLQP
jgi:hypothetical protein